MLLLISELLLLPVPRLLVPMVLLPIPRPNNVVVFELPTRLVLITWLLVAPSAPLLCNHTTALEVPALVLVMVKLREAVEGGQIELMTEPLLPLMMMKSAALITMMAEADD